MNFSKQLIYWYLINGRKLPWRATCDPYPVWLSEIILQQTRVEQGLPYYERFIKKFPSIFDLAHASEEEVLKLWQGLGYYSRARNLHSTAKFLVDQNKGKFPKSSEELKKLKGIGDYTAAAIASICFAEPVAVVDGNVYRVLSRAFGIYTPINSSDGVKEFKKLAQDLLNPENPGNNNQAVMELGARVCKPKNPDCENCPVQGFCVARNEGIWDKLPIKTNKLKVKNRFINYLVFRTPDNKTRLTKREKGIWTGLYEFPMVESSKNFNLKQLMANKEFIKLVAEKKPKISLFNKKTIVHKLSHQHLFTNFWLVQLPQSESDMIPWSSIGNYPVSKLIDKFLMAFKNE
jgi:A/G-specific adenine glycosylase